MEKALSIVAAILSLLVALKHLSVAWLTVSILSTLYVMMKNQDHLATVRGTAAIVFYFAAVILVSVNIFLYNLPSSDAWRLFILVLMDSMSLAAIVVFGLEFVRSVIAYMRRSDDIPS